MHRIREKPIGYVHRNHDQADKNTGKQIDSYCEHATSDENSCMTGRNIQPTIDNMLKQLKMETKS